MSEFLFSYGLFFAKIVTVLFGLIFAVAILSSGKAKESDTTLKVTNLNGRFKDLQNRLKQSILDKKAFKQQVKADEKASKKSSKGQPDKPRPKLFVLEFEGDIKASGGAALRDEITAILSVAEPQDEVLIRLDNSGGMVHEHGLAASQIKRIRDAKLHCTVSVDKVAASGGYMMACVADKIVAAPFSIIGSIGVIAQLPNFNRLLDKAGVDFEQHTAGEFKRTVTMFGKNSDKEREKLRAELQETHVLFRDFVSEYRPKLDIEKVATGEHWYGTQALELGLVDEISTSDEILVAAQDQFDIYAVQMQQKKTLQQKLLGGIASIFNSTVDQLIDKERTSRFG